MDFVLKKNIFGENFLKKREKKTNFNAGPRKRTVSPVASTPAADRAQIQPMDTSRRAESRNASQGSPGGVKSSKKRIFRRGLRPRTPGFTSS